MAFVGKSLDDTAFRHPAASALIDHARQLQPQGVKAGDPALDFRQPGLGDRVG